MAPYKKVTRKEYKLMLKPWITKEILQKCKMRDSLIKSISKENDPVQILIIKNCGMKSQKNNVITKKNIMLNILKIISANLLKLGKV